MATRDGLAFWEENRLIDLALRRVGDSGAGVATGITLDNTGGSGYMNGAELMRLVGESTVPTPPYVKLANLSSAPATAYHLGAMIDGMVPHTIEADRDDSGRYSSRSVSSRVPIFDKPIPADVLQFALGGQYLLWVRTETGIGVLLDAEIQQRDANNVPQTLLRTGQFRHGQEAISPVGRVRLPPGGRFNNFTQNYNLVIYGQSVDDQARPITIRRVELQPVALLRSYRCIGGAGLPQGAVLIDDPAADAPETDSASTWAADGDLRLSPNVTYTFWLLSEDLSSANDVHEARTTKLWLAFRPRVALP